MNIVFKVDFRPLQKSTECLTYMYIVIGCHNCDVLHSYLSIIILVRVEYLRHMFLYASNVIDL